MTDAPQNSGIKIRGTALSPEETAALLTVINTQVVTTQPENPPVNHSNRNRVVSTWADVTQWHSLPRGA